MYKKIFTNLNKNGIKYLHFKSNEHLKDGLEGNTDLDILVLWDSYYDFVNIITGHEFRLFEAYGNQKYNSIFDYLHIDKKTGRVLHIHLHCSYKFGKKFIKEYVLPIENLLYFNSFLDNNSEVRSIDFLDESILLLLRTYTKNSFFTLIKSRFRYSEHFMKEYLWLMARVSYKDVSKSGIALFLNKKARYYMNNEFNRLNKKRINFRLYLNIKKSLKLYKTKKFSTLRYFFIRIKMITRYILKDIFNHPLPYRRIRPEEGKIIVFIGADGSGKSTISKNVFKNLSKKIDVYYEYFGSGDGKSSFHMKFLKFFMRLHKRGKTDEASNIKGRREKITIARLIWAIGLSIDKKQKLKKIHKAKSSGMLVICDRYPQTFVSGINDGPLLTSWKSQGGIKKLVSNWEFGIYNRAEIIQPDLLFRLIVDEETAVLRKPYDDRSNIHKKIEIINYSKYKCKQEITVDANREIAKVMEDINENISLHLGK